ncbi:hypothetical protein Gotri_011590 [Gossypium trilobum]|uniref:Uncharacterized protein n=1 Tax=Gossypium trilobum TaxID=34281 RepID=A0A7J9EUA6_9ROSI|nr:hypothetical protein [Gossypium trilobum]
MLRWLCICRFKRQLMPSIGIILMHDNYPKRS